VHKANELPVDYISISPVFETNSKQDVGTIVGIDGLRQLAGQSRHTVMAIGGINEQNVREVIEAGAQGVAVISAIHNAYNLKQTIENLLITKEEHV
jgi:thiamine-phosphate pyrophosphorylase